MTAAIANLALNLLMVALLVATIFYCWLLNKRIKVLQDSKSELAGVLRHFDESTQRASESILALQTASKKIGENIQGRIDKANFMLDDLAFMIEKGNKLADQMEAGFAVGRARSRVMTTGRPEAQDEPEVTPEMTMDEDEWDPSALLPESLQVAARAQATRQVSPRGEQQAAPVSRQPVARQSERQPNVREKTSASLSAVLERIAGKVSAARDEERIVPQQSQTRPRVMAQQPRQQSDQQPLRDEQGRPRSKVEQELLEILRAGVKG